MTDIAHTGKELVPANNLKDVRWPNEMVGMAVDWYEFSIAGDPDTQGELLKVKVNVSFLTSTWKCIFGQGCPGVLISGAMTDRGCCQIGVHMEHDDDDYKRVRKYVNQLTEEDLDANLLAEVQKNGWRYRDKSNEGESALPGYPWHTRVVDGACVLANRAGGSTGKVGCSLHVLANRLGLHHSDTKPNICWQIPLAVTTEYDEEHDQSSMTVTGSTGAVWGDRNPTELHSPGWWCVAEGSLITTDRGQVPIEEVSEGDRVLTRAGFRKVLARWDNGQRPVVEVVHERGSLFVTEDHKILTQRGWVQGRQLHTSAANTMSASGTNPSVLGRELVSLRTTSGASHERLATLDVFTAMQTDGVSQVDAQAAATQVVDLVSLGDRADNVHPQVDGRVGKGSVALDDAISLTGAVWPIDALVCIDQEFINCKDASTLAAPVVVAGDAARGSLLNRSIAVSASVGVHGSNVHHVKPAGMKHVYDLSVEGQHEYVADGVVVHNCTETPDAYVIGNDDRPNLDIAKGMVYRTNEIELRKLMGDDAYDAMASHLVRIITNGGRRSPTPGEQVNGGRPLIPLMVAKRMEQWVDDETEDSEAALKRSQPYMRATGQVPDGYALPKRLKRPELTSKAFTIHDVARLYDVPVELLEQKPSAAPAVEFSENNEGKDLDDNDNV